MNEGGGRAACGHPGGLGGAGRGGAVRHHAACRRGRARHQGGAAGGRLRAASTTSTWAGECAWFVWLNRGKESVVLDIKDDGRQRAAAPHSQPARTSSCRTSRQAQRHGRASIRTSCGARHPRLITCDISGYGESGPYAAMKAYDFLIQCESGIASVTGTPESASRVGVSVCDIGAGLNAYGAILEALHGRHRTGRGSGIRVSLFDGMADWMTVPLLHLEHAGKAPARTGLSHAMIAPYGAYPVGDGGRMVIAIQNEREWARFCEAHPGRCGAHDRRAFRGTPGPAREPARDGCADRRRLRPAHHGLARGGAARSGHRLRPAQRCRGAVRSTRSSAGRRVETPAGTVEIVAPPARHADSPPPPPPRPRAWGAERGDPGGVWGVTRTVHRSTHDDAVADTMADGELFGSRITPSLTAIG